MRNAAGRTALALAAACLVMAACSGDDVDLADAEAEMTNLAVDVIVQVSGEPEPNVSSERIACQDDLLRDNGLERASVSVGTNVGADRDPAALQQAIAEALAPHDVETRTDTAGVTYVEAAAYGISVEYYPTTGLLAADGTTDCG